MGGERLGEGGLLSHFPALSLWECVSLKNSVLVSPTQDVMCVCVSGGWGGRAGSFILFMQKASTYSPLTPLEISLYRTKFIPLYFIEGNAASDRLSRLKSNNESNLIVAAAIMFESL